jgi:hypothetical protein
MSIKTYERKRNFDPEPQGRVRRPSNPALEQQHDARTMHFDFRL